MQWICGLQSSQRRSPRIQVWPLATIRDRPLVTSARRPAAGSRLDTSPSALPPTVPPTPARSTVEGATVALVPVGTTSPRRRLAERARRHGPLLSAVRAVSDSLLPLPLPCHCAIRIRYPYSPQWRTRLSMTCRCSCRSHSASSSCHAPRHSPRPSALVHRQPSFRSPMISSFSLVSSNFLGPVRNSRLMSFGIISLTTNIFCAATKF